MKPKREYAEATLFTTNWLCGNSEDIESEQKGRWQVSVKIDGISRFEIHCKSQRVYDYTKGSWRDFSGKNRWVDLMGLLSEHQDDQKAEDLQAKVNSYFARRFSLAVKNKHKV